ncbi:MAG: DUF4190 domain-containing protein [Chloroflexaceae bacterium]|jgi:hypothetical protein|nr:DUF4190 domain-containing protein [Chloroflexaceae bacterium]
MNCPRCGASNDDGSRFCYNCGTALDTSTTVLPTPPVVVPLPPTETKEQGLWNQPFPPAPQPMQPYGYAPMLPQNSSMAITSMVLGIVGWVFPVLVLSIGAVVTGHMARAEIRRSGGQLGGDGMAIAGLVLGYLQIGLYAVGLCLAVGFFALVFLGLAAAS